MSDTTSENIWQADNRTYLYPLLVIYVFIITKMIPSNGLNTFLPVFIVGVYGYSTELVGVSMGRNLSQIFISLRFCFPLRSCS
ncbi:hypothetical protein D8S78_22650 [Natrialba swarupiae]|nr:hypothetical protein [Natrialba swarupiae]